MNICASSEVKDQWQWNSKTVALQFSTFILKKTFSPGCDFKFMFLCCSVTYELAVDWLRSRLCSHVLYVLSILLLIRGHVITE